MVRSTDLRADPRWPRLAPAVATNRIRGVLSVPVGLAGDILGTCNAITHSPRGWTDADAAAVVAFGAVIGRLLRTTTEARRKGDLAVQLQTALDSRIVVEQAKGVLMEREGLSAQAAFERLRRQARSRSCGSTTWPVSSSPAGRPSPHHEPLTQSSGTWRSPGPT